MTISGFLKRLAVFLKDFWTLKREEMVLRKEVFEITSIEDRDVDFFKGKVEQIVSLNARKSELKSVFREDIGEMKEETVYGIKRVLGDEEEFEDTPSLRDEPSPISKVNKDESLELKGLKPSFRRALGEGDAKESSISVEIPGVANVPVYEGSHTTVAEAEVPKLSVETGSDSEKPEEAEILQEAGLEGIEEAPAMDNRIPEFIEGAEEVPVVEEVMAEEEKRKAEMAVVFEETPEEDSGTLEEGLESIDPRDEAKAIIDRLNEEGIKLSTSVGKDLKKRLEVLGFVKDIHWKKDPETKNWFIR